MEPVTNGPEAVPESTPEPVRAPAGHGSTAAPSRTAAFQRVLRGRNFRDGAAALSPRTAPGPRQDTPGAGLCSSQPPAFGQAVAATGSATVVGAAGNTEWAFDNSFTPALLAEMEANPGLTLDEVLVRLADRELKVNAAEQPQHHPTIAQFGQTTENTSMTRAGRHMATLVANSHYLAAGQLQTPGTEAAAFRTALAAQGYDAEPVHEDLTAPSMEAAFGSLVGRAEPNDDLVAYYSGHGSPEGLVGIAHGVAGKPDVMANGKVSSLVGEATGKGAHIRFVMDSCHSGSAVEQVRTERSNALRGGSHSTAGSALLAAAGFAQWCKGRLMKLRSMRDEQLATIRGIIRDREKNPPPKGAPLASRDRWTKELAELKAALPAVQARFDEAIASNWILMWSPLVAAAAAVRLVTGKPGSPPIRIQDPRTLGLQLDWLDDLANAAAKPVDQASSEGRRL